MPRRRLCRCLKISGTRLDAGNCVASRLFPQQIPGFLVLTVLLISELGTEKKTGLACNLLCRNDVPRVCWNQIDRGKIKGTFYVSPMLTSAHLTAGSAATLMGGGFDLHQKTLRIMLYHKVVAGGWPSLFAFFAKAGGEKESCRLGFVMVLILAAQGQLPAPSE
jgi:hypothetical protein